jgi:hypothetical protein
VDKDGYCNPSTLPSSSPLNECRADLLPRAAHYNLRHWMPTVLLILLLPLRPPLRLPCPRLVENKSMETWRSAQIIKFTENLSNKYRKYVRPKCACRSLLKSHIQKNTESIQNTCQTYVKIVCLTNAHNMFGNGMPQPNSKKHAPPRTTMITNRPLHRTTVAIALYLTYY